MKYLPELMLEHAVNEFEDSLTRIGDTLLFLNENFSDRAEKFKNLPSQVRQFDSNLSLADKYDQAINRLAAVKKSIGLLNKINNLPPEEKSMHKSRMMANMNRLRAEVNKLADETAKLMADYESSAPERQQMANRNNVV